MSTRLDPNIVNTAFIQDHIIRYTEGVEKKSLCQKGEPLGSGFQSDVYVHRSDSKLVVKKSGNELKEEFAIGFALDHPCIVKMKELFVKTHQDGRTTYKLVMDKIDGQSFADFHEAVEQDPSQTLALEDRKRLLTQAKECCRYLFEKGVCWGDLQSTNVFLTKDNNLMICDLGAWTIAENTSRLAQEAFEEAIMISSSILGGDALGNNPCDFCDIFGPKTTCGIESLPDDAKPVAIDITDPTSYCYNKHHNRCMAEVMNTQLLHINDGEKMALIDTYFDGVIERL